MKSTIKLKAINTLSVIKNGKKELNWIREIHTLIHILNLHEQLCSYNNDMLIILVTESNIKAGISPNLHALENLVIGYWKTLHMFLIKENFSKFLIKENLSASSCSNTVNGLEDSG